MPSSLKLNFKKKGKLFLFFFIGVLFNLQGQLDSIAHLKQKLQDLQKVSNFTPKDTIYINAMNRLARELRYYNKDSLFMLANEAKELSEAINYRKGTFESTSNLADYYLFTGKPEITIEYCNNLLQSMPSSKFAILRAKIHNQIGQANFILGNYPLAYTSFLKSLEISEKQNLKTNIVNMNMNLGTMFSLIEDYEEAINFYNNAQDKLPFLDDEITSGRVYSNLGFLYMKKKDVQKSVEYLDRSIKIFTKYKIPEWRAFAFISKAELYLGQGKYEKALQLYQEASLIHKSLEDVKGMADVNYGKGMANLGLGNIELAESYLLISLELFESFQLKTGLEKCFRALYQLSKQKNLTNNALAYLELARMYADSISKDKQQRDIGMLNTKMKFERDKLALQVENEKKVNQQKKYVQWATLGLVFSIIVVVLMLSANRREKKLNKALEEKTVILSENQKKLNKINKDQDKLFSIVGHDLRGPIVSLKELLDLALESPKGETYFKKYGPKLKHDIEHIHFTLDNLLNWGLTQMKGAKLNAEVIYLKNEIKAIKNLFRKELSKKSISLKNKLTDDMAVFMDFNHFNVVFRNLISNAIKFTPENGTISINAISDENQWIVSVKDNGVGISQENLTKIFDGSAHYSTFGTNNEKGTGLGLALCKEMIEKNNGSFTIKSSANNGTTVQVSLPKKELV